MEKYIIKRSDGKYFWRGNIWYISGWKDDIKNAYMFSTLSGVYRRAKKCGDCKIIKIKVDVNIKIIDEDFKIFDKK